MSSEECSSTNNFDDDGFGGFEAAVPERPDNRTEETFGLGSPLRSATSQPSVASRSSFGDRSEPELTVENIEIGFGVPETTADRRTPAVQLALPSFMSPVPAKNAEAAPMDPRLDSLPVAPDTAERRPGATFPYRLVRPLLSSGGLDPKVWKELGQGRPKPGGVRLDFPSALAATSHAVEESRHRAPQPSPVFHVPPLVLETRLSHGKVGSPTIQDVLQELHFTQQVKYGGSDIGLPTGAGFSGTVSAESLTSVLRRSSQYHSTPSPEPR